MALSLKLFGGFAIRDGAGGNLSLPTRKTCALLGYLAANADRPLPRESLVELLWGDRGDRHARRSLNQALVSIRKLTEDNAGSFIDSDGEQVTLHGAALDSDIARFHALLDDDPAAAAALYDGPFLDGLSVPDSAFEEWLAATRAEFEAHACDALHRAAGQAAENGDVGQAIEFARRLLSLDPLREDAHRLLMRLLSENGDRIGALRQYQACADILEKELQVAPDAATRALFDAIRRDAPAPDGGEALPAAPNAPRAAEGRTPRTPLQRWIFPAIAACVAFVAGTGAMIWLTPWSQPAGPVAQACSSLTEKPSIAVLPFANLSGDPQQEYFSDGITEDIISRLARRPDMTVTARTSSFAYKGRPAPIPLIGRDLGVGYLLEGSVQKSGDRIRITTQLVEAGSGNHIWAERYDRNTKDLFAIQDEIAHRVAVELAVRLTRGEVARINFRSTDNFEAYDYYLRGMEAFDNGNRTNNERARKLFETAIELDPRFARAVAKLGSTYLRGRTQPTWGYDPEASIARAEEMALRALAIDENSSNARILLAFLAVYKRQYEQAVVEGKRAVAIEPSNPDLYAGLARIMLYAERPDDATELIARALCLSPYPPSWLLSTATFVHYRAGRYEAAITAARKVLARKSGRNFANWRRMIASFMALGRKAEARAESKKYLADYVQQFGRPYSLGQRIRTLKSRPHKDPSWIDVYAGRLREAGFPD